MEAILNFNDPLDVNLVDQVVNAMYSSTGAEAKMAERVMTQFQEHPDAWTRVDAILEKSQSPYSKFIGLKILEDLVKYRWKIVPDDQREAIKSYVVNLIIKTSSDAALMRNEKTLLDKLDVTLVQIIKQEWPNHWSSFVTELVESSRTSETVCENNMQILKILSEEIFDFSSGEMTDAKVKELKGSFYNEFNQIYQLCEYILHQTSVPSLLFVTLGTLLKFLNWIQLVYILKTDMIELLITKFLPEPMFRNVALQCITEIGGLSIGNAHDEHFVKLFGLFMPRLRAIIPPATNIPEAYDNGSDDECQFVQNLALFFVSFFKSHLSIVETQEHQAMLIEAHNYLVNISAVDDTEIFKICLEYWNILASDLYHETPFLQSAQPLLLGSFAATHPSPRRQVYSSTLSKVRYVIISRMAKPEDILIVEDEETGEIVREVYKDTDSIILYKSMRQTLIFLTHLDYEDTRKIMHKKLKKQCNGREFSWNNLNTLCWAIGSISGAMTEDDEKRFLVEVIKVLLELCEMTRGKDNKAVIASNIMYIVGQYPRFLRAHWRFLKTVVNKLFEFMHEPHPGVQDMACDTFLKIAQKCQRKFVTLQAGETHPFVEEILTKLTSIISDLEASQIHTFYEAVGHMISWQSDDKQRRELIQKLMALPNQSWSEIMANAARDIQYLHQVGTAKSVSNILRTNVRVATSLGQSYKWQLNGIFMDLLNVYRAYSDMISTTVAAQGSRAMAHANIRAMRAVKRETLKLLEVFVQKSSDTQVIVEQFVPYMLEAILGDYNTNIPDARDAEVLSLFTETINKLQGAMTKHVPRVFEAVFECTLSMITGNFEEYPELRVKFFNLLRAINQHCFQALFLIPQHHFKFVIDSIVWAFKHIMRNIAETGLMILLELWVQVAKSDVAQAFYQTYFLSLLQDVFGVLTDTFHKTGFKLQATTLLEMFRAVEEGEVTAPLWDPAQIQDPNMNNKIFLRQHIANLIGTSFKNLTQAQVTAFVNGLFQHTRDLPKFKTLLRDFLVSLKSFSSQDNADLFIEETEQSREQQKNEQRQKDMAIPGMVPVYPPKEDTGMAE
eukprot:TRINITY_DN16731_c0_g1_i1.p1 TRINITY_DN16731_c0_g1~~TRINITY_DN16731_c0_g1_i1.p1  ORF type:complete len:1068 (-),score=371.53 TRINITY_DN16731_c0_g1_i1:114-3317(-)